MDEQSYGESSLSLSRSHALFEEAQELLPGGVNSPVRAFRAVGGEPVFIDHASGPYLYDVDGNRYLDYVQSWGPMILGHADPAVLTAVIEASRRGFSFGAPTHAESILARLVIESVPSIEMVRFVNSGTVATMGLPDSPGVPSEATSNTLVVSYNDSAAVEELFRSYPGEIAAIIVEPAAANMGLVPPLPGFLERLRSLCNKYGALLIFDEVMTGFRVALGGMQERVGILPDLTCLGKIIGGGLPVGAYGGSREIMQLVAPLGPMYQAGTLSGNPLTMAAGIATLQELRKPGQYKRLERKGQLLDEGIERVLHEIGGEVQFVRVGAIFCLFFTSQHVIDYASAKTADTQRFARYFWRMLKQGVYLPPSQFEGCFISLALEDEMIGETVEAVRYSIP